MCGIIGYVGEKSVREILLYGLKKMEYRGYDSAGLSVMVKNKILTYKKAGKVAELVKIVPEDLEGNIGIAHTRWATHGLANDINAHPHVSTNGKWAIAHNGIIENYESIRKSLKSEGVKFKSQTDSEVIAHLLAKYENDNFEKTISQVLAIIHGTYGIVILNTKQPDVLWAVKKGSPLCLGIGEHGNYIASDVNAFLHVTKNVVYLNDGEIAKVTKNNFMIKNFNLKEVGKKVDKISWSAQANEKGNYSHYMLKEICEQAESLKRCLMGRSDLKSGNVMLGGLNLSKQEINNLKKIKVVACGTSYHAGLIGMYLLENLAELSVSVRIASEFRYMKIIKEENELYLAISQSGETADTYEAIKEIHQKDGKVLGICNVVGSTIAREVDGGIYVHSGPEIAVASTKAFTSQVMAINLLAIHLARRKNMSLNTSIKLLGELENIPNKVTEILKQKDKIAKIAAKFAKFDNFLFLGRGVNYPVALEGALKLKEISYKNAEGIASGEIKHGPIALVNEDTPVVMIMPHDELFEKNYSNMQEIKTRGGKLLIITDQIDDKLSTYAEDIVVIPQTDDLFSPLLTVIPLQLLAYYVALSLGTNIDQPRNLAKSVTVE